jgi:hypothetical protein
MSTKIYNAFKFNGKAFDLMKHIRSYRIKWQSFQINRICEGDTDNNIGDYFDNYKLLYEKIESQSLKKYPSWEDFYDVRGSVVVYFHKRKIYVQTFLQSLSKSQPPSFLDDRFSDFHYQNQGDPWYEDLDLKPDEKKIAARNWRMREKVWNEIFLNTFDSPNKAGLVYNFCESYDFHLIAGEVLKKLRNKS